MTRARTLFALLAFGLFAALPAAADSTLLGLCSEVENAQCDTRTAWSVQDQALTPQLNNPDNSNAAYQITVTEGPTSRVLKVSDVITLNGMMASGTEIAAIFLSIQKGNGSGGYTTVASAAIGDTSSACGCPYVASSMTLSAQDSAGAPISTTAPLLTLAAGAERNLTLNASWNLSQGLIHPGDDVRIQPCVAYAQAAISLPPGCYANGGGVRAVKACSGFSLDSCAAQPETLTETLSALSSPIASLGGFVATSNSPSLTPGQLTQSAGGAQLSFTASATGNAGTVSTLNVSGAATCIANGTATLTDLAALSSVNTEASIAIQCDGIGSGGGSGGGAGGGSGGGAAGGSGGGSAGGGGVCNGAAVGESANYSVFVFNTFTATGSDIEGALAAGGDISFSNYAVGASLSAAGQSAALVTAGNLKSSASRIFGDAWVAGTVSESSDIGGTLHVGTNGLDFNATQTQLLALSARLAALPARGAISALGDVVLTGSDPVVNVFHLTSTLLAGASAIDISIPSTAIAIINIAGTNVQIADIGFNPGGLRANQLVLNFPQATNLALRGVGLVGTVLAPNADVALNSGAVLGQIFAKSYVGAGQVNLAEPLVCIPLPAN